jgi:hypothetical protein
VSFILSCFQATVPALSKASRHERTPGEKNAKADDPNRDDDQYGSKQNLKKAHDVSADGPAVDEGPVHELKVSATCGALPNVALLQKHGVLAASRTKCHLAIHRLQLGQRNISIPKRNCHAILILRGLSINPIVSGLGA